MAELSKGKGGEAQGWQAEGQTLKDTQSFSTKEKAAARVLEGTHNKQ